VAGLEKYSIIMVKEIFHHKCFYHSSSSVYTRMLRTPREDKRNIKTRSTFLRAKPSIIGFYKTCRAWGERRHTSIILVFLSCHDAPMPTLVPTVEPFIVPLTSISFSDPSIDAFLHPQRLAPDVDAFLCPWCGCLPLLLAPHLLLNFAVGAFSTTFNAHILPQLFFSSDSMAFPELCLPPIPLYFSNRSLRIECLGDACKMHTW
jgi:hypothetical protein